MSRKTYRILLSDAERTRLSDLVSCGAAPARAQTHARVLLKADQSPQGPAWTDAAICDALQVSPSTVIRIRRAWVSDGFDAAVQRRRPRVSRPRRLDGRQEAHLLALSCSTPPAGQQRWSLRLLASKAVELEIVESIAHTTVRTLLKKNVLKPWLKREWCIPPGANAAFVAAMEDILDVYARPFDRRRPLVCFDEGRKELRGDVRAPLLAAPGYPLRYDTEYSRHGAASFFLWTAPLLGQRGVLVTERRTRLDFAHAIRALVDVHFPEAERIVLVMDNLNTHTAASLYEAFLPAEAKRLWDKLEVHYTPKHGSWLNIAEIELSVLGRQCLDRRIADIATLAEEVAAWVAARNAEEVRVNWRFTTEDARIKLKHLYPILEPVK